MRVVLDTNVLLSGLVYPKSPPGRIVAAWQGGSLDVVLSNFILDELRRVLPRLSHRHALSPEEINELVDILSFQAEVVEPINVPNEACRDPNDLAVIGTLLAATQGAGVASLITGDKDLLSLADRFNVLTASEFCSHFGL
jgi:putative PIN family toxin of toxin-antitoxin system